MERLDYKQIFINNLKKLLLEQGKTQADICKDLGYTASTVSGWFISDTMPRGDNVRKLADYFGVSTDALLSENPEALQAPSPLQKQLLKNFNQLNQAGQQKAVDQVSDLLEVPKYQAKKALTYSNTPPTRTYFVNEPVAEYQPTPIVAFAAAGHGFPNVDYPTDYIKAIRPADLPKHAQLLKVDGNSMSPTYQNGDYIWCVPCEPDVKADPKEIYIVLYDGDTYMKKIREIGKHHIELISINPEYKPITVKGYALNDLYIRAKVLQRAETVEDLG